MIGKRFFSFGGVNDLPQAEESSMNWVEFRRMDCSTGGWDVNQSLNSIFSWFRWTVYETWGQFEDYI